jgi:hypothetical protein
MVGDGKGSHFMHLLRNALHLTLQARCHNCPGCHFELKQVGFNATYRPRQCLLTSRNISFSIFRAALLEPHGSESCTWHNRDLIRTKHVLTQRRVATWSCSDQHHLWVPIGARRYLDVYHNVHMCTTTYANGPTLRNPCWSVSNASRSDDSSAQRHFAGLSDTSLRVGLSCRQCIRCV